MIFNLIIEQFKDYRSERSLDGITYDSSNGLLYIDSNDNIIGYMLHECFFFAMGNSYYCGSTDYYRVRLDTLDNDIFLTYDMVKGIIIKNLPQCCKYQTLLEKDGVGLIILFENSAIWGGGQPHTTNEVFITYPAFDALKAIAYNSHYDSITLVNGVLNIDNMSTINLSISYLHNINIVLYEGVDLYAKDVNVIFLYSDVDINSYKTCRKSAFILPAKNVYYKTNINGDIEKECPLMRVSHVDVNGIIKSTAKGYIDNGECILLSDLIDYDKIIK